MESKSAYLYNVENNNVKTPIWTPEVFKEINGINKIYKTRWERILE